MGANVTVGIPYHKYVNPTFLRKSIQSILDQSLQPDSIHLIRDGQVPDKLEAVIEEFDAKNFLKINFNENHGLAHALNKSINMSKTKYYARMDADDISLRERLKKQINFLESNKGIDILGTWAIDIDDNEKLLSIRKVPSKHEDIVKYIWTNPLIHSTVVFRTESIKRTDLYNPVLRKRQDYEFWFRCAKKGLKFGNLPESLLHYRFTEDWFVKYDSKAIWKQVKIGWRGCYYLKLPVYSYLGVSIPLIKVFFPKKMGITLTYFLKKVDPRSK